MSQRVRLGIGIATSGYPKPAMMLSLTRLIAHFYTAKSLNGGGPQELAVQLVDGHSLPTNRERLADWAQKLEASHLLFIDDDMGFREQVLPLLFSRDLPYVAVNYRRRIPGGHFTARKLDDSGWVETTEATVGVEEVAYTGFGMALIRTDMLEAIPSPRFNLTWVPESRAYETDDVTFCHLARKAGYQIWLDHDASKLVYHVGAFNYGWDDNLDPEYLIPTAERMGG